jgi:hypothetical protein
MVNSMKKEDAQQLELFSQIKKYDQRRAPIPRLLLNYIWAWEKTILIIIGLIITGIVSFSLGVERGKRITQLKTESRMDIALKTQKIQPALSTTAAKPILKKEEPQPTQKKGIKEYIQNYTIQVASFLNRTSAQKEADTLKRKGLASMLLPKGKFIIVCVGSFSNRQEAEYLLPKLKKQYQDCRIRRL